MDPKWIQNRVKSGKPPKMASRWLPGPLGYEGLVDFQRFLGPPWELKNHQKSIFCEKGCAKKRFLSIVAAHADFLNFLVDFVCFFHEKTMEN